MNHMKQISWILMPALLKSECEQCSECDEQSHCSAANSSLLVCRLKSPIEPPELSILNYAFERNIYVNDNLLAKSHKNCMCLYFSDKK